MDYLEVNSQQIANNMHKNVRQILDLLKQGETILRNQYREQNVTFILGNTGAGKSTFIQWITGDNTQLISKRDSKTLAEFIIYDANGKIGNSTTISKTIFPELMVDTKTGAAYYDFPGFYNTRGAAHDIATTFFIKKVLDHTKSVKIVFIVNHNSVTNQGTRDDFTNLIKFTTKFVKNIDKFQNSIVLIASKVSNTYSSNSDNEIISFIARFIEEVKQNLVQNAILSDLSDKEKMNAIKFLETLLIKDGEVYSKIGLFRSPNKEGPLSNITLLQENKKHIETILETLHFTTKTNDDFGYAIPKASLYEIGGIVEELNKNILTNVRTSGEEIKKYFSIKEETVHDIKNLYHELRLVYDKLLATKNIANTMELNECIQHIKNDITSIVKSSSINQHLSNAINYSNYFKFLQIVSSQSITNSFKCAEGLSNVIEYFNNSQKWYHFLLNLYDKLSKCYVLQNISMYDITNLIGKGYENKKVIETSLEQFLQKVYQEQYHLEYNDIKGITLDKFKLESLKQISNATLNYQIKNPLCAFHNTTIANNKSVTDLYNTLGFINELEGLEEQFYKLSKEFSFLPFYKSLLHRISQYAEKLNNDKKANNSSTYTDEDKKVLSYLYTAILSKICSMNNNVADNLVIDLRGYLDLVIEDIKKLQELNNVVTINEYQINYKQVINAKTSEAEHVIETQITPEINNIFNQVDHQIELLINETIVLQNAAREEKSKLIEQQQKLEQALVLRTLLGVTMIASQFLSFAGPVGAAAGAIIGGGMMVAGSLALDDISATGIDRTVLLPSAVKNSVTRITEQLKNKQQLFKEQLHDVGQKLAEFLDKQPSSNIKDINKKISDAKLQLDQEIARGNTRDPAYVDKIYTKRKEIVELLQNQKEILEKQKPDIDIKIEQQLRIINHVQNIVSITEISMDLYGKIRNNQAQIDKLGDAIKQSDAKIIKLAEYEKDIYKIIIPICRNIENRVTIMQKNLQGKSHIALDISKWQIQSALRDVKLQMQKMTKGFNVQEDVTRCIDKLEEGMSIMINIYNRIEDYHDQAELAAYIANIHSNRVAEIKINNTELNYTINNLRLIIQSNLVLAKYKMAMNAFKQYMFPFTDFYLTELNLPSFLKSNDTNSIIVHVVSKIKHLKSKIDESTTMINKYDKYIHNNIIFNSKNNQTSPFFVWKHNTNKHTILKLFEGEEITIKADITQGLHKNAIKFNVIGINFKLKNETIQYELDKELQNFEVTMTHLGNSYYRCGNKFYIITSDHQTISYCLSKNNNEEPLNKNLVYDKIKNNIPVLSPYTLWTIKLNNISDNFGTLAKYQNQVIDLELEGHGQYVDQGIDVCNENLNKYYTLDDTITISHHHRHHHGEHYSGNRYISDHYIGRRSIDDASSMQYDTHHVIVENTKFTSSAANNIKSPINIVINWLSNSLGQFKFFNPANIINYEFIKGGLQSMFGESKQLKSYTIQDYSDHVVNIAKFNVNDSLTLANFVIRYFTKVKPYNTKEDPIDLLGVKAYVLNIITEFEELLNDPSIQNYLPIETIDFDPVVLMSKLEKEVINGNYTEIGKILHRSIINNNSTLDETQFSSYIQDKISAILVQQNAEYSYNQQLISDYSSNNHTIAEDMKNIISIENYVHHSNQSEVNLIG